MIVFGSIEGLRGGDFGDDWGVKHVVRGEGGNQVLCRGFLIGGMVEDHGSVLRADVVALAVEGRGIVNGKKHVQEISKSNDGWVERDLHDFRVTGSPRTHGFI